MSAIEASSGTYRSRVDGTIVLSVEIEPRNAAAALALFGMPGTPLAVAALQVGYEAVKDSVTTEKAKGGALAKLAGMWCNDPEFWKWISKLQHEEVNNAFLAAQFIRETCGIESRAELDHNEDAEDKFHRFIRGPFQKYLISRGIVK